MRLIAIPLARIRPGAPPVTTFLAQTSKAVARASGEGSSKNAAGKLNGTPPITTIEKGKSPQKGDDVSGRVDEKQQEQQQGEKLPLAKRLMNKASDFWIGLGKEDQKSTFDWKKRTYNMGEKLMDRIEYEEWALKGVDPALGPSLKEDQVVNKADGVKTGSVERALSPKAAQNVPLLFPSSLLTSTGLLSSLQRLTASRQPHHRQRLMWCVVGMPLTIPFILIPVIPNLPFFYLLWRAYSHWKALSSSKYLSELIKQGRIVPTPSKELDQILSSSSSSPASSVTSSTKSDQDATTSSDDKVKRINYEQYLLLTPQKIKELEKEFKLEHQMCIELTRARQQTIKSIGMGEMNKLEEAAAGHATSDNKNVDKT